MTSHYVCMYVCIMFHQLVNRINIFHVATAPTEVLWYSYQRPNSQLPLLQNPCSLHHLASATTCWKPSIGPQPKCDQTLENQFFCVLSSVDVAARWWWTATCHGMHWDKRGRRGGGRGWGWWWRAGRGCGCGQRVWTTQGTSTTPCLLSVPRPPGACPVAWWARQATMPPPFLPCLSEVHLFGTAGGAKAIAHNSRAWRCTATAIAIPLMRSQRTKVVTSTLMCIWIPGWCVIVRELK